MKIDGYVELDMYSIHIDSMGLWSACALGMKQLILPYQACVYHIDHEDGWESDDVIKTIKFLSDKPSLDYSIVYKAGMKMVETKTNWGLNKADWGWADENFDERRRFIEMLGIHVRLWIDDGQKKARIMGVIDKDLHIESKSFLWRPRRAGRSL